MCTNSREDTLWPLVTPELRRLASSGEGKTGSSDVVASVVGLKGWVKGNGDRRRIPREGTV